MTVIDHREESFDKLSVDVGTHVMQLTHVALKFLRGRKHVFTEPHKIIEKKRNRHFISMNYLPTMTVIFYH